MKVVIRVVAVQLLVLAILLVGCNLLNKRKMQSSKENVNAKLRVAYSLVESKDFLKQRDRMVLMQDSGLHSYQVQVWPRGVFSFSADSGFKGKADRVVLSGEVQKAAFTLEHLAEVKSDQKIVEQVSSLEDDVKLSSADKKTEHDPSIKIAIAAGLLVILISYWLARK